MAQDDDVIAWMAKIDASMKASTESQNKETKRLTEKLDKGFRQFRNEIDRLGEEIRDVRSELVYMRDLSALRNESSTLIQHILPT